MVLPLNRASRIEFPPPHSSGPASDFPLSHPPSSSSSWRARGCHRTQGALRHRHHSATLDTLLALCERHALEVKLVGQIECWGEMLFHIELWSREASRRQRSDVVGLLEDQRTQAIFASHRACEDLDALRRSETSLGEVLSGGGQVLSTVRRETLPLPPKAARPPFLGLRRLRRR
jgi:hypothetical protein